MAFLLLRSFLGALAMGACLLGPAPVGVSDAAAQAGPADGTWRRLPPPEHNARLSFVDPVDGRLTVLRNYSGAAFWKFNPGAAQPWTEEWIQGPGPSVSDLIGLELDRVNRRIVLLGFDVVWDSTGPHGGPLEVWALSLDPPRAWRSLVVSGPSPDPRFETALAYDASGPRLFLVGGFSFFDGLGNRSLGDIWQLDLGPNPAWTEVAVAGPALPGAEGGISFYEPVERRVILMGAQDTIPGNGLDEERIQAIAVDGDRRWVTLDPPWKAPGFRFSDSTFDPVDHRLIQLRGAGFNEPVDSLYALIFDGRGSGLWTRLEFGGASYPYLRGNDRFCVDPATHELVLFGTGGEIPPSPGVVLGMTHADVWRVTLEADAPWARHWSSIAADEIFSRTTPVLDPVRRKLISLSARFGPDTAVIDQFSLGDASTWSSLLLAGPGPWLDREGAITVFDPVFDRMFLFGGGRDNTVEFGDLWELSFAVDPPRWRRILGDEALPVPRSGASGIYDPERRRIVVFGGYAGEARNDTWELDLRTVEPRWRRIETMGSPPPARWDHSAVYDPLRDGMVVFGGATGTSTQSQRLNDTWFLSFADCDAWVAYPVENTPPLARSRHAAVYDPVRDRMIVLGGRDQSGSRFDHHALALGTPARWSAFQPQGQAVFSGPLHAIYDGIDDRLLALEAFNSGRVYSLDWDRDRTPEPPDEIAGGAFRILGVGPNPSRGDVNIAFELPRATAVQTRLYDVRGRLVRDFGNTVYQPGPHILCWDGKSDGGDRLRDGVYFARIVVEGRAISGKIVLMD